MIANYLPIYKAKPGEFQALSKAKKAHDRKMLPFFEVCKIGEAARKSKKFRDCSTVTCTYLEETAQKIAEIRQGKNVLVDAFQWDAGSLTETGEHILPYIWSKLESLGVGVVPVIGYDRWDSATYRNAMQGFEVSSSGYYCLRLDSHAIEDAEDPEFFEERVMEILDVLNIEPERCAVLLDFGDVTALSIEDLIGRSERVMSVLASVDFKFFATAGCSLAPTINGAVKKPNSTGKVMRKEMLLWQAMRLGYPKLKWIFGDYGVRGPGTTEDIISPHTNGKIRHTISQNYFIVRGHSVQEGDKGAQMYRLAKTVVDSVHYMGEDFSWGDAQILACSQIKTGPGNATIWIAIDTSHHLAWVIAEVEEFEQKIATATARV